VGARQPGELARRLAEIHRGLPPGAHYGAMTHFNEFIVKSEEPAWIDHWKQLYRIHDYSILLVRQNHLRQYLSMKLANRDLEPHNYAGWGSEYPRPVQPSPIHLDLKEFTAYCDKLSFAQRETWRHFPAHNLFTYEQLVDDWEEVTRTIYAMIGLDWNNPQPSTFRQEKRELSEIIANWNEVSDFALAYESQFEKED
jgi:hypothetical protein